MPLIGFDQDPGAPQGMGTFHFDDGRTLYAHDPETAATLHDRQPMQPSQELMAAAKAGPDQRTALNGFTTTDQRLDAGGAGPALDAMQAPKGFPAPAPQPQAQPPAAVGGGPVQQGMPDPQAEAMKFIGAPVRVAATRGGVIPKSQSKTIETDGLPYDPDLAQQRSDANIDVMVAKQNTAATMAARAQAESLAAQAQLPALQKQAAAAQQEQEAQQTAYRAERADLDHMIAASQTNQKSFNANHWMESRGVVGQIGAVLAQAMGAYAATLGHGENWAQKIINQAIDRDIQTQKEQIESGKEGVTNALQKLKLRYGDMGQAEAALKIAMGKQTDAQALAYAKSTGSQDIMNTWQEQVAKNEQDRVAEEQKFMAGAIGKVKTTVDARVVAPSAGGMRDPTVAEMSQRADLAGKIPGIAEKSYDAELKRQKVEGGGEQADKNRALVIEGVNGEKLLARSEKEAQEIRKMRGLQLTADKTAAKLEDLSGVNINPATIGKYEVALEATINSANSLFGQGVVRSDDIERYKKMLKTGPVGMQAVARELRETINTAYQSHVDSQRGASVSEDYAGGPSRTQFNRRGATTPTITPPSATEYTP